MNKHQAHTQIHVQSGLQTGQVALATAGGEGGSVANSESQDALMHSQVEVPAGLCQGYTDGPQGRASLGQRQVPGEDKGCRGRLASVSLSSRQSVRPPCLLIILPGLKPECLG